ncbi:unnamed protein product, partial [marine sediment metagenome]
RNIVMGEDAKRVGILWKVDWERSFRQGCFRKFKELYFRGVVCGC